MQPNLAELKEQGVEFFVFTIGDRKENEQIFAQLELDVTILYDHDFQVLRLFGVDSFPQTFFIDKQGRAAAATVGWGRNSYEQEFLPIVQALLDE